MKALSVKNPWVDLIFYSDKDVENRTWRLPETIKGAWILIHASKGADERAISRIKDLNKERILNQNGKIVGAIRVTDCIQNSKSKWAAKDQYHWIISDKILFKEKDFLEAKGQLNLWNFDLPEFHNSYFREYWNKKETERNNNHGK